MNDAVWWRLTKKHVNFFKSHQLLTTLNEICPTLGSFGSIMCCAVLSHSVVSDSLWPHGLSVFSIYGDSPRKNTGVGWHVLLQGIFQSQGLNPGLLHCRRILYHLSHLGNLGRSWQPLKGVQVRVSYPGLHCHVKMKSSLKSKSTTHMDINLAETLHIAFLKMWWCYSSLSAYLDHTLLDSSFKVNITLQGLCSFVVGLRQPVILHKQ